MPFFYFGCLTVVFNCSVLLLHPFPSDLKHQWLRLTFGSSCWVRESDFPEFPEALYKEHANDVFCDSFIHIECQWMKVKCLQLNTLCFYKAPVFINSYFRGKRNLLRVILQFALIIHRLLQIITKIIQSHFESLYIRSFLI